MIDLILIYTGPAAGNPGSASAAGVSPPISGEVLAVLLRPSTGSSEAGSVRLHDENDLSQENILHMPLESACKIYPRREVQDSLGQPVLSGGAPVYDRFGVHGRLEATLTGANPGESVSVYVWVAV